MDIVIIIVLCFWLGSLACIPGYLVGRVIGFAKGAKAGWSDCCSQMFEAQKDPEYSLAAWLEDNKESEEER